MLTNIVIKALYKTQAKIKGVKIMGMTDKQFNGYLRLIIDKLETIKQNSNEETTNEIDKLIKMLAETMAD